MSYYNEQSVRTSIENLVSHLFTHEGFEFLDEMAGSFYCPVLVQDIGQFRIGDYFSHVFVDFVKMIMILYKDDSGAEGYVFNLKIDVAYVGMEVNEV